MPPPLRNKVLIKGLSTTIKHPLIRPYQGLIKALFPWEVNLPHRIHGTKGIFTYMFTIKINHSWIGKYTIHALYGLYRSSGSIDPPGPRRIHVFRIFSCQKTGRFFAKEMDGFEGATFGDFSLGGQKMRRLGLV